MSYLKKIIITLLFLLFLILITGSKVRWNTWDEGVELAADTCKYYGLFNQKLHIRLVIYEECRWM